MSAPFPAVRNNERGIALVIALVAIVVIGALVTGTFFAGRIEMSSGRNTLASAQATEAAEAGIATAYANWNSAWNSYGIEGDSVQATVYPVSGSSSVRYTQTVRKMRGGAYLVSARGEKLDAGGNIMATRLLAMIGKLSYPWLDVQGAVTSYGTTTVGGNATIDGRQTDPPGWPACTAPDVAGVRTSATVTQNGTPQIFGSPPLDENDAGVVDSTFTSPYNAILPLTTITLTPGTYNSMAPTTTGSPAVCDKSNSMNWGEPARGGGSVPECYDYFPVIWSNGNLHLTGGTGQGILLVNGDLRMQGGFEFVGIVIVMGEVITTANSSKVTGAILARNVDLGDLSTFGGTPVVAYSKCAIEAALQAAARGVPLAERSWAQVNPR